MRFDEAEMERGLRLFIAPGQIFELRVLDVPVQGWKGATARLQTEFGFYTLAELAAVKKVLRELSGKAALYFTPNPLAEGFSSHQRFGEFGAGAKGSSATDNDVTARCWLLIDFDPVRTPKTISSTAEEKAKARSSCEAVKAGLDEHGWPWPITADSGNGYHLCYRIDLPNDEAAKDLVKRCLAALKDRFPRDGVVIDLTSSNAARIWKLPGSLAIKGRDTPERPHRLARVIDAPPSAEELRAVPMELLERLAGAAKQSSGAPRNRSGPSSKAWPEARILDLLTRGGFAYRESGAEKGGPAWLLQVCPFVEGVHSGGREGGTCTMVGLGGDGIPWLKCHGERCLDKGFLDLVQLVDGLRVRPPAEPGTAPRKRSAPVTPEAAEDQGPRPEAPPRRKPVIPAGSPKSAFNLIQLWATENEEGPRFIWREGSRCYSERTGQPITSQDFAELLTPELLLWLLEEASELTFDPPEEGKKMSSAKRVWTGWAKPAFQAVRGRLPERAEDLTRAEDEGLTRELRDLLMTPIQINKSHEEIPTRMSLIDTALQSCAPSWDPVGTYGAYVRKGGALAIRYDALIGLAPRSSSFRRLKRNTLAKRLADAGLATSDVVSIQARKIRLYVISGELIRELYGLVVEGQQANISGGSAPVADHEEPFD